jgi:hypothetical protein
MGKDKVQRLGQQVGGLMNEGGEILIHYLHLGMGSLLQNIGSISDLSSVRSCVVETTCRLGKGNLKG